MSNPGVIYLANKKLTSGTNVRIEDNIGEAIHIHYGEEWRIDLTTKEFFELNEVADRCLNKLLGHTGFDTKYFDPIFLDMFSEELIKLEKITFEKRKLSELKVQTVNRIGLPVIRSLTKSVALKSLRGNIEDYNKYDQINYRNQSNAERLMGVRELMSSNVYPYHDEYIVLFNNQNNIRDGRHRAACLYDLYGNIEVSVIVMQFKDNFNNVSNHPWRDVLLSWMFRGLKRRVKLIYLHIRSLGKKFYRKVF